MSKETTELRDCTPANVEQLRKLNLALFPVNYSKKFYENAVKPENREQYRLAFIGDVLVGAICWRWELFAPSEVRQDPSLQGKRRAYIMTLGVLAVYRERGIGSQLLEYVIQYLSTDTSTDALYLHVQTSNEGALEFYKKHKFQIEGKIENYYRRLDPPDCYILKRNL